MLGQLLKILLGILALIGAGAISYTYLEKTVGPREAVQVEVAPVFKKIATTSTQIVPKKVATKAITTTTTNGSLVPKAVTTEKTVVAPGPLRVVAVTPTTSDLTVRGVIEKTNTARALNPGADGGGLYMLTENYLLDRDAQMKLDDMFAKQYFEHVSPSGVGPADLAQAVGYAYVIVGENLALGDFGSDQGVVTAWMNSPGHRANILNPHYQEIGVAVEKGMYEGHMTWLAVQSFGMPLSSCPVINANLKAQIDANSIAIATLRAQLDAKKAQIDSTSQQDSSYNTYVNEFNAIVPQYNALVEANRASVSTYNAGVQAFNACIGTVTTATH